jgi:hypothetical protein
LGLYARFLRGKVLQGTIEPEEAARREVEAGQLKRGESKGDEPVEDDEEARKERKRRRKEEKRRLKQQQQQQSQATMTTTDDASEEPSSSRSRKRPREEDRVTGDNVTESAGVESEGQGGEMGKKKKRRKEGSGEGDET